MADFRLIGHLERMLFAVKQAISFLEDIDDDAFLTDVIRQNAVCMSLVVCGEHASRILEAHRDFAADNPEVEWLKIRGMRNRIAHGYFDLQIGVIYKTVTVELPLLKEQLLTMLKTVNTSQD
jgi:uncharacterized protein with HEPN domain